MQAQLNGTAAHEVWLPLSLTDLSFARRMVETDILNIVLEWSVVGGVLELGFQGIYVSVHRASDLLIIP